jgi:FkbM family methyltransferase
MKYYSQYGQDQLLNHLLNHKKFGIFIDIGAHDGVTYSNSYFFEKEMQWSGICVEPIPEVFKKLVSNRNCITENCAISDAEGEKDFTVISGYGEMASGFNRETVAQSEIEGHGGSYNVIKIPTFRLDTILNKHNIKNADFCSIDVETHEIHVVKSIDWRIFNIEYLCIEANTGIEAVVSYLSPFYKKYATIVGDVLLKRL